MYSEFPGGPVVGTLWFHCPGPEFDSWWGNSDPTAMRYGQKKKKIIIYIDCKTYKEILKIKILLDKTYYVFTACSVYAAKPREEGWPRGRPASLPKDWPDVPCACQASW